MQLKFVCIGYNNEVLWNRPDFEPFHITNFDYSYQSEF